jgi:hypothetical protein
MVSKAEYLAMFDAALRVAASNTELAIGHALPTTHCIHLHGLGYAGIVLDPQACVDLLYIDAEHFHPVVDIAVVAVSGACLTTFVRVSSLPLVAFDKTWNTPHGNGPFHQLLAKKINETPWHAYFYGVMRFAVVYGATVGTAAVIDGVAEGLTDGRATSALAATQAGIDIRSGPVGGVAVDHAKPVIFHLLVLTDRLPDNR